MHINHINRQKILQVEITYQLHQPHNIFCPGDWIELELVTHEPVNAAGKLAFGSVEKIQLCFTK
jgi:hypothetical protein